MATIFHYDWDPDKAAANLAKHKVSFHDARTGFEDPLALTIPDTDNAHVEERWITIGASSRKGLLLGVHTHMEMSEDTITQIGRAHV